MSGSDNTKLAPFPRPQISDWLVLTLCASVVLGFNSPGYQDEMQLYDITWQDLLPNLIDEFVTSFCLFGLIVLLRQSIRRAAFVVAPGHIALWTIGPFEVFGLILGVFRPFYSTGHYSVSEAVDYGACALVYAASLIYPLLTTRKLEWWWRVCLYLLVLSLALCALECVLDVATNLKLIGIFHRRHLFATIGNLDVLIVLATCVAVALDWTYRKRRDWLHYGGVLVLALHAAAVVMHGSRGMRLWWQSFYNFIMP